jgi:hypothetical protein
MQEVVASCPRYCPGDLGGAENKPEIPPVRIMGVSVEFRTRRLSPTCCVVFFIIGSPYRRAVDLYASIIAQKSFSVIIAFRMKGNYSPLR